MAAAAGKLDRRIEIQRYLPGRDVDGAPIDDWEKFAIVWASVEVTGGSVTFQADHRTSEHTTVFTIRYQPGVEPHMQVVHDGDEYRVEHVEEVGRREFLRLTCVARDVESGGE